MKLYLIAIVTLNLALIPLTARLQVSKNYVPTIDQIEESVKKYQDPRATQTFDMYQQLLNELAKDKYITLPLHEFKDSINKDKVVVALRHDVDCHPFKALQMAHMEAKLGIRTTYFILATGGYYGKLQQGGIYIFNSMDPLYSEIYNLGHEIGIHNDLIVVYLTYKMDPFIFNQLELMHYADLGIPIYGSVAHGSDLAAQTVKNFYMFSDYCKDTVLIYQGQRYIIGQHSMKEFGFEYEANFVNHTQYYSDSGGKWNLPGGFNELLEKLKASKPGDRIQILAHPVWW